MLWPMAQGSRSACLSKGSFLKSEKVIQQSKVVSILDNNEGRSYWLSRMGSSSQLLFKQTRESGLQEELPRPLLCEATAPAGPQGAFHCVWLAAWALILANVTYVVVNFKTPSDTASKMYTKRGKNFLKEQKNKQWMKIY